MSRRKVSIVVGANYGDEGKGLVTDYLSNPDTVVVRFNGGAQAGHTVVSPDGIRHVFHHFGSGTLAGAATYLSHFFIANPFLFLRERTELLGKGVVLPPVYMSTGCMVTTPWDMLVNQMLETQRGVSRHGSCGVGINETVTRDEAGFGLTVFDLQLPGCIDRVRKIRDEYFPRRLHSLGLTPDERFSNDAVLVNFLEYAREMLQHVEVRTLLDASRGGEHLVFEGAQGLCLDQNMGNYPWVTRSCTGIANAMQLLPADADPRVYYVTRPYLTRHGAGPLPHETPGKPYERIFDNTNVPHDYQGTLRFAHLNLEALYGRIEDDAYGHGYDLSSVNLVVTCMDQVEDKITVVEDGGAVQRNAMEYMRNFAVEIGSNPLASFGPTRDDVRSDWT